MSAGPRVAWVRISPSQGVSLGVAGLNLIEGLGIEGDRHAGSGKRNQVLLMDCETLEELSLEPGDARENVATRGLDLTSLREGDRLRIGPDVDLVITSSCPVCSKMESLRAGLQEDLSGRRGMLATVVVGGTVTPGDEIAVVAVGG